MVYLISLICTTLLILYLCLFIKSNKHQAQIKNAFVYTLVCLLICCIGLIAQILFSEKLNINPIYFDYFVYIGTCFLPVAFFFIGLTFAKTKVSFKKSYLLLFIVPIISLLVLWTNDYHHLFYKQYSTNIDNTVFGPYFYVHTAYTYLLFIVGFCYLLKASVKHAGIFSKQALLIILGTLIPIIVNSLGSLNIIPMTIYITPISFVFAILFCALAIYKFGFLNITPIAFQRIADRMSNGYIVLNDAYEIVDCNKPLLDIFEETRENLINKNFFQIIENYSINTKKLQEAFAKIRKSDDTVVFEKHFSKLKKYFTIEINSIKNKDEFIGVLILLNDITEHKNDLQTIKNNQEILIERERLATLGQMIGGIAHNLKTPIMSISGAAEGILDLVNEYRSSIDDPEVTIEDHKDIANDMEEWIKKIQSHLAYMSDVITTVKGQAVAFSDNKTFTSFTIDELIKQVNILMKHELSHALIELEETIDVPSDMTVKGNINSLVQVVNNIISNAIQAYNGKAGEKIILDIYKDKTLLVLKIQDFAGGLPDIVKQKLFKEMTTTKGKNGTGLGLFMSYSNIKAHFNGNIRYETRKRKRYIFLYRNSYIKNNSQVMGVIFLIIIVIIIKSSK